MAERNRDELLRAAGKQVREEIEARDGERFDQRWDDYCAGTLAAPEVAALKAEAADSRDIRLAATLFEPLGDEFKASLVRTLREEEEGAGKRDGTESPRSTPTLEAVPDPVGRRSSSVADRLRHLLERLLGVSQLRSFQLAASLAAAALVAIVGLYPLTRPAVAPIGEPGEGPIPNFELELQGSSDQRSGDEDTEVTVFKPGQRFRIRMRPKKDMQDTPKFRVYVRREGGEPKRWQAAENAAKIETNGTMLIEDPEWEFDFGEWTLYLVVGRSLPPEGKLREFLDQGSRSTPEDWQIVEEQVRVVRTKIP